MKKPGNKLPAQKKPASRMSGAKKPSAAKMASLTTLRVAMAKAPPASAFTHKVLEKSPAIDVAQEPYVDMLNNAPIDIDSPPLADYDDYNDDMEEGLEGDEFGEGEDADSDEEGDLQEIEEGAFDGAVAKAKGRAIWTGNYIELTVMLDHAPP
jgi:hypothetical protein